MHKQRILSLWRQFEIKIILIILGMSVVLSLSFYFLIYTQYHDMTIGKLKEDAKTVHKYVEEIIDEESFTELNVIEDEKKEIYLTTHKLMDQIRRIANIRYLYTAKKTDDGRYIYVLDGLDPAAEDFRHVGAPIEEEIIPKLEEALRDETVLGEDILVTEWGIIYVTYFPVHDSAGNVIGAIGLEFDVEKLHQGIERTRLLTVLIAVSLVIVCSLLAIFILRKVVQVTEEDLHKKDALLIAAKEEALASSKAKSEFLSRMSHELRTPMNAVIGMTQIAKKTDNPERLYYCLDKIANAAGQLLDIINNVLDMSKIEADKFEIFNAEFNFEKLMQRVFSVVQVKADEKHLNFTFEGGELFHRNIISDELRLSQVLINLLGNAVKFTPEYGRISLKIRQTALDDDHSLLHVEVEDTGIGLDMAEQERLFSNFEQADSGISRQYGGTGLGLAICKKIVNAMGGDITVESAAGQGSRFSFIIKVGWGSPAPYTLDSNGRRKQRVLVVEDDPAVAEYLQKLLESFSMLHDHAVDNAQALGMLRSSLAADRGYDAILLDWTIPGMDGPDTVKKMNSALGSNAVVIMIPATDWSKLEKAAPDLGLAGVLPKPILPSALLNALVKMNLPYLHPEKKPEPTLYHWENKRILLVEDNEINREVGQSLLEEAGLTVDHAHDGLEAVEMFEKYPEYDLILMDIQMPRLDGLGASRKIRASGLPEAATVPIVAMTANAFKEDIQACLDAGMNKHIAKPIDTEELMRTLAFYLSPGGTA